MHAGDAIRAARQRQLPIDDMLACLVASTLYVPLAEPPQMDGDLVKSWKPATAAKANGSQWLIVFTDTDSISAFAQRNPSYSYQLQIAANWVLQTLPSGHGLAVNIGSPEIMFEWHADGIRQYMAQAQ
ncbi:MAG: SseB family protein [Solimonas sp.]